MQIPKFLLLFCVATLGLSTLQAQRVDTEEQAKARELLRKKMAELDAQQPAAQPQQTSKPAPEPTTPPKKPKVKKAAPKPAPVVAPAPNQQFPVRDFTGAPPLTPSAPAVTPPPAVAAPPRPARIAPHARAATPAPMSAPSALAEGTTHLTPEAEAKAREELRQKMAELDSSKSAPPSATTTPAPKAPAKPKVARKKEKKAEPKVLATPAPTAPAESPIPAVVPSAENQKLAEPVTVQQSNPPVARKKQKQKEQYVFDTPAPTTPVESPIPAAVSSSKNQQLTELLTHYRANAITPEEYHKKRAEILAQP
jgi:hypothetical protein